MVTKVAAGMWACAGWAYRQTPRSSLISPPLIIEEPTAACRGAQRSGVLGRHCSGKSTKLDNKYTSKSMS